MTPDLCLFNPGIDNETEIKSEDSEYQEWEDKLDSIDLNDPDELVSFIEEFLRKRGVEYIMSPVGVGEEFAINLCSNASTGFQWIYVVEISDSGVVEQVSYEYIGNPEKGNPPPPGTPGKQVWSFKALKGGTSTLFFEYSRDWEGGEKGKWTFVLIVDVK